MLKEKTTDKNSGIDKFPNIKIIDIVLGNVKITPDEEIYVYIGTYKINPEIDIIHGSIDYEVSRSKQDADYVLYKNIESKYNGIVQIPYKKAEAIELTRKVIFSKNVASRQKFYYDLQSEYFETLILESPEKAKEKVNKLLKK